MVRKYGTCIIPIHIENVWNNTIEFWLSNYGEILDQYISPNSNYRKLIVCHGTSVYFYGTLMGELYEITFGYQPVENITYINFNVKFANVGKVSRWKRPQFMLIGWSRMVGNPFVKLTWKKTQEFRRNYWILTDISNLPIPQTLERFCPVCGEEDAYNGQFCEKCGTSLLYH